MLSDDEDMFADLEKTLCEGLDNLRAQRDLNTSRAEIDVSCLEDTKDLSKINGPAVRAYNLYKANMAFKERRFLDSVYCESFAMSLFMRIKFFANKIMENDHLPTEENLENFLEARHVEQPELIDYLDHFLKDMDYKPAKSIEFENGSQLMQLCSELPNEWTVIQLCKQVNPDVYLESRDETLKHQRLIFLTLLRYPMSERFDHKPIKIMLGRKQLKELFEESHRIYKLLNDANYRGAIEFGKQEFEEKIVNKMKDIIGPWIVCFSGKTKPTSMGIEQQFINEADSFLATCKHKYSRRQKMLVCLIARRVYMLTNENIRDAAAYISKTKYEYWELWDFFEDLQARYSESIPIDTYPVILVVDEHIDFMFWEMCNPVQEFTRVESIVTLLKLYFHHQDNVVEGYFKVKGRNASAVIDPDRTLEQFDHNVTPFLKLLPCTNWNILSRKEPTFTDLRTMLASSDVHVYLGHNSGMQFISSYQTTQLSTKAVVFLMGCSSVAFKSDSGYALGTAPHHYYHIAKSPAVIGLLNLTYTTHSSLGICLMLGKWFSNLAAVDAELFAELFQTDGSKKFFGKIKNVWSDDSPSHINYSPYLSKVISQIRSEDVDNIVFRAIICHRGLPVVIDN